MQRYSLAFWVFVVGVVVSVGQIAPLGSLLPEPVASHFGTDGRADGYMPRATFVTAQYIIIGFIALLFATLPALLRIAPAEIINLPDKDYWLAPERHDATLSYVADRMYAFGAATLALMTAVLQLVYLANANGSASLGGAVWVYLGFYLTYTVIWTVALLQHFTRPTRPSTH